ncbi:MAG: hypothetical protein KAS32_28080 [Candidatus Peribacteraceae bacterium]|nr:hypothetical protein [Candidatus Peribacteraceae bacterium]
MTEEDIKEYLKKHLSISLEREYMGSFSSTEHIKVSIFLGDEEIDYDYVDIDDKLT